MACRSPSPCLCLIKGLMEISISIQVTLRARNTDARSVLHRTLSVFPLTQHVLGRCILQSWASGIGRGNFHECSSPGRLEDCTTLLLSPLESAHSTLSGVANHGISLAPVGLHLPKRYALQIATRNTPSSNKSKVLVGQFGRAAGKDLSSRMLKDLRSKAKHLYSAAAREEGGELGTAKN